MKGTKRTRKPQFEDTPLIKKKRTEDSETTYESGDCGQLSRYLKDAKMINQLKKNGITSLFPIQQATFSLIVKGHDLIAKDRTGSGKTLAYSLPCLEKMRSKGTFEKGNKPKILVMLPTRELALQVRSCFEKLRLQDQNWKVLAIYGGQPIGKQMDSLKMNPSILIATPGRLIDFINRGLIKFQELKVMVLDEADQMLKQGFKQDIQKIFQAVTKDAPEKPQVILFSATIPPWLQGISSQYQQKQCKVIDLIGNETLTIPKTIKHMMVPLKNASQIPNIAQSLCDKYLTSNTARCFIFCETKREVNELNTAIGSQKCKMLHGDVKQYQRERIYRGFKSGQIQIIIATNVAARGLDFPDVELVIQVEPPKQIESYIHRAGRTGRAGKAGTSVVLVQKRDMNRLKPIEKEGGFRFKEIDADSLD